MIHPRVQFSDLMHLDAAICPATCGQLDSYAWLQLRYEYIRILQSGLHPMGLAN